MNQSLNFMVLYLQRGSKGHNGKFTLLIILAKFFSYLQFVA